MCARFEQQIGPAQNQELFLALGVTVTPSATGTDPTIHPTDRALVVAQSGVLLARFGLHWTGRPMVLNARSETLRERPTFSRLLHRGRAIVPLNGFYEKSTLFRGRDTARATLPLLLGAALVDDASDSFVILTQPADEIVSPIHPRMPVLMGPLGATQWLTDGTLVHERIAVEVVPALQPPARTTSARRVVQNPLFEQGRLD
ncbi:SOS response-associated peptidase family protein [Ferrimicrobium sp.]|uniref:SOS response-associated peptidase family protein n=1 Tax=Ferrimicrobium sp. TaxID=2926050 RepID=UPI002624B81E|nr:SOS response-associated peptidase family protein [Ferrimicrobium sp.]